MDVLKSHEEEKIRKYNDSCAAMGGCFTPFVISADGVLAPQAWKVIQTLAAQLTEKHNSLCNASLGETINWLRLRLQFASVRAASLALRAPKKNYPLPISFAEGRAIMPRWLYRDF
jgi:hypothetical protein